MMTLVAIRKSIHMWIVEKGFVAISPRETLRVLKKKVLQFSQTIILLININILLEHE